MSSCTTYEGSSLSLVPFIDSSRRATQPFTVGGKLVMGLLHRYTSRRFIKPPISSGSDVNLLLHVVTTQTHTQAHAHTRRQAWREYHTMRRWTWVATQRPPTHLLKVRCSRSGKHMISGGSVVILFWYLRTGTHAHGHGRMRMSASLTHTAAQPQTHRHNTCGKPNATNMCSSRRHVMPCNRSPDKTLICSARTCEEGVCDGNMRGTAGHVHHCCRR